MAVKFIDDIQQGIDQADNFLDGGGLDLGLELLEDSVQPIVPPPVVAEPPPVEPVEEPAATAPETVGGQDATVVDQPATSTTETTTTEEVTATSPSNTPIVNPVENILSQYNNYSYSFELYAFSAKNYNQFMDDEVIDFAQYGGQLLISTGGNRRNRNRHFSDDFYIDDVDMSVLTPTNGVSRNTNMTSIKFKIIEPYGVTLLERLRQLSKDLYGQMRSYAQMPYILNIKFRGYNDDDEPANTSIADRVLPITLTNIRFEVTPAGSEYSVDAIPYNATVFNSANDKIPFMMQLRGDTVGQILANGVQVQRNTVEEIDSERVIAEQVLGGSGAAPSREEVFGLNYTSLSKGLSERLEAYQQNLVDDGHQEIPNRITVEGDPELMNAEIIYDSEVLGINPAGVQESSTDTDANTSVIANAVFGARSSVNASISTINATEKHMRIQSHTSVIKLIEILILHSRYIQEQLTNPSQEENLNWFKITPSIRLIGWDKRRGQFAYQIKYYVSKYRIPATLLARAPRGRYGGKGYHKEYNYLYTGDNKDILDFKIDYNVAFHRLVSAAANPVPNPHESNPDAVHNVPQVPVTTPQGTQTGLPTDGQDVGYEARDAALHILNEGPDLMSMKMDILGDPSYIMQTDIFRQQHIIGAGAVVANAQAFLPDGTINFDLGQTVVRLYIRYPQDYNPDSGLMFDNTDTRFIENLDYTGDYTIHSVKCKFEGGVFTQTLSGVRIVESEYPTPSGSGDEDRAAVEQDEEVRSDTTISSPVPTGDADTASEASRTLNDDPWTSSAIPASPPVEVDNEEGGVLQFLEDVGDRASSVASTAGDAKADGFDSATDAVFGFFGGEDEQPPTPEFDDDFQP